MDILQGLAEHGAVYKDLHFVYKSKTHGPHYINPDAFSPDVAFLNGVCEDIAWEFRNDAIDVVVSAAVGGIPTGVLVALHLSFLRRLPVQSVWGDKDGDNFVFERAGFAEKVKDKRVLFVEDLLNKGDTTKKVVDLIRQNGGEVIGAGAICNRGGATAESLGVPRFVPLSEVDFEMFDPAVCPLCQANVPIVADIGHGAEYKAANPDYPGGYISLLAT